MNRIATHSMSLPAPSDGAGASVPEWIHLVPAGSFKGRDGRGPWVVANAAAVINASDLPLAIDEAHATDLGAPSGAAAPARGWIEELQVREDGIWGRVAWTPTGMALLAERAYRGISPTFSHDKNGKVLRLLRAALTNVPNLPQLATLNHQEPTTMDLLAQLRQLHGLPADADEAAALNACRTAHQAVEAHGTALNAIAEAAGLSPGQDATALAAAITTARVALEARLRHDAAGEAGRMAAELTSLQSQVTTLQAERAKAKAEQVVDAAIRDGKPIKALRDHYIARHAQDPKSVEAELAGLPALNAGGITPRAETGTGTTDPTQIAMQAQRLQDKERAAGREINIAEAVQRVVAGAAG
jgi:phage I-like protein